MAARALATGTGPRTATSVTVVARVIWPEASMTAASAVGPSSHGTVKTRWSLAQSMSKPSCSAVVAYRSMWSSVKGWLPKSIRGR